MLVVPTDLRPSPIHGIGVFLLAPLKKGNLIWRFDSRVDRTYSQSEIDSLPKLTKDFLETYGCWHEAAGLWMVCGDNGRHFNHSDNPTTLSVGPGQAEDIAAFDLAAGTELTTDYRTICDITQATGQV